MIFLCGFFTTSDPFQLHLIFCSFVDVKILIHAALKTGTLSADLILLKISANVLGAIINAIVT